MSLPPKRERELVFFLNNVVYELNFTHTVSSIKLNIINSVKYFIVRQTSFFLYPKTYRTKLFSFIKEEARGAARGLI